MADDPVAAATEVIKRAMERGGRPATTLERAELAVAQAYVDHHRRVPDDGSRDPCGRCRCCRSWTPALELLRAHAVRHQAQLDHDLHDAPTCGHDDCLVCAQLEGWR